jgi:ACT domain-containing protein
MQDFAITEMCQAFEVSRSGYYQWKDGKPSKRQQESDQIIEQIPIHP